MIINAYIISKAFSIQMVLYLKVLFISRKKKKKEEEEQSVIEVCSGCFGWNIVEGKFNLHHKKSMIISKGFHFNFCFFYLVKVVNCFDIFFKSFNLIAFILFHFLNLAYQINLFLGKIMPNQL